MPDTDTPTPRPRPKPPVAWLLGRDLIASLQGTLLYTAFGSKLDPRKWMRAKVDSFENEPEKEEFWFDYIADSGDGTKATYGIAYLSLSNLYVEKPLTEMPPDNDNPKVSKEFKDPFKVELPRGKFLLVGGDTSYHLSDYATLGSRFYQPFRWAFEDLWKQLKKENRTNELNDLEKRRPIFGIPGNHDYYDQLDGFRRQFRHPTKPEKDGSYDANMPTDKDTTVPQLMLPGFERLQKSSYVALELPFGWWLWGLDTEAGLIDDHQTSFFENIKKRLHAQARNEWKKLSATEKAKRPEPKLDEFPQKLILATCSPTTSFGRFARGDDKKSAESVAQLKLPQPFMPDEKDGTISARSGDAKLEERQCRLDLSGDYHFYARYWGPRSMQPKPRKSDVEQPSAKSYASVISGLGGAFHHPSQTYFGDLQEQVLYPSEDESRKAFAGPLFNFKSILMGGGVGIIGFFLAFVICFTATVPKTGSIPREFLWANYEIAGILIVSLILIVLCAGLFPSSDKPSRIKTSEKDGKEGEGKETKMVVGKDPAIKPEKFTIFGSGRQVFSGLLVLASWALLIGGLKQLLPLRDYIKPFGNSVAVFWTLLWSIASIVVSLRYSEWLFKQASRREIKRRDWVLAWMCTAFSVFSISYGIGFFGEDNQPAFLITDMLFVLATLGVGLVIVLLAAVVGGADFKWKGKVGMGFIGIWHAILQLTIPLLLVNKGNAWTLIIFPLLIVVFGLIGWQMMKRKHNYRWFLLGAWLFFGALMITLPYLLFPYTIPPGGEFAAYSGYIGKLMVGSPSWLADIFPSAIAGLIGLLMSCIWLGWYFAVSLAFNAHNNEVGGAGRIEKYKEFIRFKLTKDKITGYVIAFDEPQEKGKLLKPRLIDVFSLKVKGSR
jgi:hypothetical protein